MTHGVPHVSYYNTTLPTLLEPFEKATTALQIGHSILAESTLEKVKLQDKIDPLDTRDARKERTDLETRRRRIVDYMELDAEQKNAHADVDADEPVRQPVPDAKVSPSLGDEMEEPIFDILRAILRQWAGQNGIALPEPAVQSASASVGQLRSADDDGPSTIPTEDPSSIFTDDRQPLDATSSTDQLTAPSELDLAHLGASLGALKEVWGEDFSDPQVASLTAEEEESQLMRMIEHGQSEQSSWAWRLFQ